MRLNDIIFLFTHCFVVDFRSNEAICIGALAALLIVALLLVQSYKRNKQIEARYKQLNLDKNDLEQQYHSLQTLKLEKRNLISLLAHDLRSPIGLIRMNAHTIKEHAGLPSDLASPIADITVAAQNVNELLRRIIQIENWEESSPLESLTPVDAGLAMALAVKDYTPIARQKGVTIDVQNQAPTIRVWGNEFILRHLFGNVLSNAINFSPPLLPVSVTILYNAGYLQVNIKDQGPGINPSEQDLIFEKYFRSNLTEAPEAESLGLGLFLTKRYIEQYNGKIEVKSDPGRGTTIICLLPEVSVSAT
jgi:two-component system sensor histidine kinase SenX3